MDIVYDEKSGTWKEHKEPFAVVEFSTEEDYNRFQEMLNFWNEHHKKED